MEAAIGIEPMNKGFADLCLTTWLRRPGKNEKNVRANAGTCGALRYFKQKEGGNMKNLAIQFAVFRREPPFSSYNTENQKLKTDSSSFRLRYASNLERETRFELATLALARRCSTTELLPLFKEIRF